MARFWLVYVTVLIAAAVLLVAQGAAPGTGMAPGMMPGMAPGAHMGQGMHPMAGQRAGMPEMMSHESAATERFHLLMMTAYVLPNLKTELELTADQTSSLNRMKQELKSRNRDLQARLAAKQKDFDASVSSGKSPTKEQMRELATMKADLQYDFVDAANQMRAALSDAQRTKLAAMSSGDLHKAMMSGGMKDMHDMTQVMGDMPQGHMMGGHMMEHDSMGSHN